jgi:RNA polymerase sigma-70 factor (ECF subfamily)
LLGNHADAEEALQEVFMRVLSTESEYQGQSKLTTWLYGITTNLCLNHIRDKKRRSALLQQNMVPTEGAFTAQTPVDILTLRWLLAHADERQAQAAVYVYLDGLSYDEVARLLGASKSTIGNLIERFQAFCAEKLQIKEAPPSAERSPRSQSKEVP